MNTSSYLDNGLRTPPVDDMSATYEPAMPAYEAHSLHSYPATLPPSVHMKPIMDDARGSQQCRYPSQHLQARNGSFSSGTQSSGNQSSDTALYHISESSTAVADPPAVAKKTNANSRRGSETLIYHSLQLPRCISSTGGSLSDFAAQMTCLFWFESIDELKVAETIRSRPVNAPLSRLPALARPHEQFRKWVYTVLSTTQVTQNVIFLALLFIYRLKMSTPQIKGRAGSEYRLLTVALMLGNKFLDDNTYTNKTWAEVSCFAVQEIHVMEVEFLSNMRYNLLASKQEWENWISKLASFHEYYDRSSKLPTSPVHVPSPSSKALYTPTPSPTATGMPLSTPSTKLKLSPNSRQLQNMSAHYTNVTSPLAAKVSIPPPSSRKRSLDEDLAEHPAKRPVYPGIGPALHTTPSVRLNKSTDSNRLPTPHLTLITNHSHNQYAPGTAHTPHGPMPSQQVVSLPPLQPSIRALSTVYPNSLPVVPTQPQSAGPTTATNILPTSAYSVPALQAQTPIAHSTPTKHPSPGNLAPAYGSSPLVEAFGPGSALHTPGVHTPRSNSPSVFLQYRDSPYKPIRQVNRLLHPPPSASLDQYHLSVPVQPNHLHYQPLGRRHDLRTGIVPEFLVYNRGLPPQLPSQGGQRGHFAS